LLAEVCEGMSVREERAEFHQRLQSGCLIPVR